MDLTCFVHQGWAPRIRPASPKRDWMEATPERFAYRCLPLAIANAHGWEVLSPVAFEARWNGGSGVDAVEIHVAPGYDRRRAPMPMFGAGTFTFHVEGLFRTPPGWNLWVGGPPNAAKDGLAPLGGVIETDWSPYTFTMNWRFTRPGHWIRFEENEPFCFFFPVQRGALDEMWPRIRPLEEAPELQDAFQTWSASREAFQTWVRDTQPAAPAEKWQKLYYRGLDPHGRPGPDDHQPKLRLAPFDGAVIPEPRPAACPVRRPASVPGVRYQMRSGAALEAGRPGQPAQGPYLAVAVGAADGIVAGDALAGLTRDPPESDFRLARFADGDPLAPAPTEAPPAATRPTPAVPAQRQPPSAERRLAHREWILETQEAQRELAPASRRVERVRGISSEQFLTRYYAPGRPVVIEGEIDGWPALSRWTPDYLVDRVGDAPVEFQTGRAADPDYELLKHRHRARSPFRTFMDLIRAGGPENDMYLTAYNSHANREALAPLDADLGVLSRFLTPGPGMMWIGPVGTFTPLHFDLTNNLLVQLVGRKQVILLPPSETPKLAHSRHVFSDVRDITDPDSLTRHPAAADARVFPVDLGPGDLLYIPIGWWHQVRTVAFSVMLTHTNFLWANSAAASFPGD